jgi:hypothetical protein
MRLRDHSSGHPTQAAKVVRAIQLAHDFRKKKHCVAPGPQSPATAGAQ